MRTDGRLWLRCSRKHASDPTDNVTAAYDAENRIAGASAAQGTFTYTYDADGNRVEKSGGGSGTLYWYMTPGIVAESDLSGNLKSEYVFFNGERAARRDFDPSTHAPTGVFYYFSDHLKTASVITDSAGNIKAESDYYPWGGELQFVANDSNHYKFTGKERDTESGLDYFGARYYSNGLGRFITPDWAAKATAVPYAEFSDPQSLNLYSYVRNIPTVNVDVDGHCDWCKKAWESAKQGAKSLAIGAEKGVRSWASSVGGPAYGEMTGTMDIAGHDTGLTQPNNTLEQIGKAGAEAAITVVLIAALPEAAEGEGAAATPKSVPESIPAGPSARPTAAQQRAINEMGEAHGCHTCPAKTPGTKSGNWVGDHQPSTAVNPPGNPQVYKPQCLQCSLRQGGQVRAAQAKAAAARRAAAAQQQQP